MASAEDGFVPSGVGYGEGCPLSSRLRGLGERRELPQRGPGQSPGRKRILAYYKGHRTLIFVPIWQNQGGQFALASPRSKFWGTCPPVPPWFTPMLSRFALRLPWRYVRILIGLLTGHNTLNRHITLLKKAYALCRLCEEEQETSLHFLGRCSATIERRMQYFARPFLGLCELKQEHQATLLNVPKPLREVSITFWGCSLVPTEASALGSNMPTPDGKGKKR